jgi:ATP-dependent RNA helicase DOB1
LNSDNQGSPHQVCAALLSCFVFDEKSEVTENRLPDELQQPLKHLQDKARRVATVAQESKLQVDIDEYVDKFKIGLMEVTCRWCKGEKFADIIKGQDLFEGSVIRCIRRLEELVVQMSNVCKVREQETHSSTK